MSKYIVDILDKDKYALEIGITKNGSPASQRVLDAVKVAIPYVERPRGEWIFSGVEHTADNPIDSDSYYCSICKRSISTSLTRPEELFPFCHCGADMRKRGDRYD